MHKFTKHLKSALYFIALWSAAQAGSATEIVGTEGYPSVVTRHIQYKVALANRELTVPGVLRMPSGTNAAKLPAVIILHGSAGIDSRGYLHALDLAKGGVVTLEIDMWAARNLAGGAAGRPARVHDTLPDVWEAVKYLSLLPGVDRDRIGVMGFSWGGVLAMLTATKELGAPPDAGIPRIAAHIAFYPVCWGYNRVPGYDFKKLNGAPLLVLAGAKDKYDGDANTCPALIAGLPDDDRRLTQVKVYPDAQHGFNMLEAETSYVDPFAHRGKGGMATSAPNAEARDDARRQVVAFFSKTLNTKKTE